MTDTPEPQHRIGDLVWLVDELIYEREHMSSSSPREPQKDEALAAFTAGWDAAKRDSDAADDEDIADAPDVAFVEWKRNDPREPREPHALIAEHKCNGCGGEYRYDTSIPSVQWNRIMRASGESTGELLCFACIIRAFAKAGESFTAELFGDGFSGVPVEAVINGQAAKDAALIQAENNELRYRLRSDAALCVEIDQALRDARAGIVQWRKLRNLYEALLRRCLLALKGD